MKNKNITFSMPIKLIEQLHTVTGDRGLSQFVTKALEKAIEAELKSLEAEYLAAGKDTDRQKTINEWTSLDVEDWE